MSESISIKVKLSALGPSRFRILADETGLDPGYIRRVFSGRTKPNLFIGVKLARALGVTADELAEFLPGNYIPRSASNRTSVTGTPCSEAECNRILSIYIEGLLTGRNYTCREMADITGRSRTTISNILRDSKQEIDAVRYRLAREKDQSVEALQKAS